MNIIGIRYLLATVVLGLFPLAGRAQIRLAVRMEYPSYLQYESAHAFVAVFNDSARVLSFCDGTPDVCSQWDFVVERRNGETVPRRQAGSPVGRLQILPGERRELVVDLTQWYDIREMGRYFVRAAVRTGDDYLLSERAMVDVVRGMELLSVTRGVPGYDHLRRTYSLRYWRRDRNEFLFLTVDETPTGLNLGVFQLGRLIRFVQPRLEIDRHGNMEIYHQSSSKSYLRTTLKSDGEGVRLIDQKMELESGEPFPNVTPAPEQRLREPGEKAPVGSGK